MKRSTLAVLIGSATIATLAGMAFAAAPPPSKPSTPGAPGMVAHQSEHVALAKSNAPGGHAAKGGSAHQLAFQNAVVPPPPGWTGPVFHLSHDYPKQAPGACPKEVCKWLSVDVNFSTDLSGPPPAWDQGWDKYMAAILDYVKEGEDPALRNEIGWKTKVGPETRWFHVPWMAYDPTQGREFVHGMTNERTARLSDFHGGGHGFATHILQLGPKDLAKLSAKGHARLAAANQAGSGHGFETWAFGIYNPWGAYSVGRGWPENGQPHLVSKGGQSFPAGLPFPEGTVVAKLLFTTATPEEVPYLEGSPAWTVDRHTQNSAGAYQCQRAPQPVRLVQMDVAVVDSRSPTRWVFGTFAYYADYGTGDVAWDHLAPVGLQWGMDAWTFPAVPKGDSIPARQSVLRDPSDPRQHFGCEHRLAGPVDNKLSSCLSCHGAGYAQPTGQLGIYGPTLPPIFGFTGECTNYSQDNVAYFQTTQFPMSYSSGNYPAAMSVDTSLQLQVAFIQYGEYDVNGKPTPCVNPNQINP
ncbi:MAG TPA: hypothetical protein VGR07_00010 [Thermoanaerobaculia bacterium]|jgi:hypothetical protein|nr:hypothetical protein [Thermoanaerobaculia bacterium]